MAVLSLNDYPPGVGFNPTDQQIINYYLPSKINGNEEAVKHIPEVDLCKFEPWDLPAMSLIEPNDDKWFFFCLKDCKNKNGNRWSRVTKEGYWKLTGRDRPIKSGQGGTEIGKKKTLVFYIGRAGKGQKRTNWVIHEYYSTCEELDGTKPGQKGSFVLLKLKKKQLDDEIIEGSNGTTIHTPLPIGNCVADNARDKSIVQDEITEGSNGTTLDTPLPFESCVADNARDKSIVQYETTEGSNGTTIHTLPVENCVANNNARDKSIVQPDTDPELWVHLPDIMLEPLDFLDKIPSPSHSQMQLDLESWQNLHFLFSNDVGPDPSGVHFPYEPNDQDINDFLNSVLVEDSGSYKNLAVECGVDAEATQAQFDHEGSSSNSNVVSNDDTFGTGIILRTRQPRDQPRSKNIGAQGNAVRRIRLQRKLNDFTDLNYKEENYEAESLVPKAEEAEEQHSAAAEPAAITDETQDIFSKFKEDHPSPEGSSNVVSNGDTFGDLSYKEENHEAKLSLAMVEEAEEKCSATIDPAAIAAETQHILLKSNKEHQSPRGSSNAASNGDTFGDLSYKEEKYEAKLVLAKVEEAEEKLSATVDLAATSDETHDILSKSNRENLSPKGSSNAVSNDDTVGDLSYKGKNYEAKLVLAKAEEAKEKHCATVYPAAITDETQYILSKSDKEHLSPEGSSNAVCNGHTVGGLNYKKENYEAILVLAKGEETEEKYNATVDPASVTDETQDILSKSFKEHLSLKGSSNAVSNDYTFGDLSYKEDNYEAKLVQANAEEAEEIHSATIDPTAITDEIQDILYKSNKEHLSLEGSRNVVSNSDTFGDLRYKEENYEAKFVLAKPEEAEEKRSATVDPAAITDENQDIISEFIKELLCLEGSKNAVGIGDTFGDLSCKVDKYESIFVLAKAEEAEEKHSATVDPAAITDETQIFQEAVT